MVIADKTVAVTQNARLAYPGDYVPGRRASSTRNDWTAAHPASRDERLNRVANYVMRKNAELYKQLA